MKSAFITGVTGQDGAYLAKLLLEKGYQVYGGVRRTSTMNRERLVEIGVDREIEYHDFELLEFTNLLKVLERVRPDEVYNLAAQSFVGASFTQPIYTSEIDALGPLRLLEAIHCLGGQTKFYQASTSEMFGKIQSPVQTEETPFYPRSPYGVAKLFAHWATVNYREAHGLFGASGILFNHESPLRGKEFVTRKITSTLAEIKYGRAEILQLGNLDAKRDWGFAGDYVEGMWRMLQHDKPDTFVLATGETRTVREFVTIAARILGFDLEWRGKELQEVAVDRKTSRTVVAINSEYFRPAEVDVLVGSPQKAMQELGWRQTTSFERMVEMMAEADAARARGLPQRAIFAA